MVFRTYIVSQISPGSARISLRSKKGYWSEMEGGVRGDTSAAYSYRSLFTQISPRPEKRVGGFTYPDAVTEPAGVYFRCRLSAHDRWFHGPFHYEYRHALQRQGSGLMGVVWVVVRTVTMMLVCRMREDRLGEVGGGYVPR